MNTDAQSSLRDERSTLTIPEVARILGCSRGTAYRMAREGQLPILRLGRRIVVPELALRRWMADPGGAPTRLGDDRDGPDAEGGATPSGPSRPDPAQ